MSVSDARVDGLSSSIRRVVTGHTAEGKAVVWKDEQIDAKPINTKDGGSARFAHLWTTDASPYDNADERDLALQEDGTKLSNSGGSVLRIVDIPPQSVSPFHRTTSLDYGIIAKGEAWLILDDGKEVHMKEGDVCVQRGTIHGWNNKTDQWSRIYFILLAAEPLKIGGKELGDAGYHKA